MEAEQNYIELINRVHRVLFPDTEFSYDLAYECDMMRKGIKNLIISNRSEADKYSILLQLADIGGININPNLSLYQIGAEIQKYYMDRCLVDFGPEVGTRLGLLWGKRINIKYVTSYKKLCRDIIDKVSRSYGYAFNPPRHIITMLYDPEIGLLKFETYKRIERDNRGIASDVIIWKINDPNESLTTYDFYNQHNRDITPYVTRSTIVTPAEAEFFVNYHYEINTTPQEILKYVNDSFDADFEERPNNEGMKPERLTLEEAEFILTVRNRFLQGIYPIDMTWDELCKSLN